MFSYPDNIQLRCYTCCKRRVHWTFASASDYIFHERKYFLETVDWHLNQFDVLRCRVVSRLSTFFGKHLCCSPAPWLFLDPATFPTPNIELYPVSPCRFACATSLSSISCPNSSASWSTFSLVEPKFQASSPKFSYLLEVMLTLCYRARNQNCEWVIKWNFLVRKNVSNGCMIWKVFGI